MTEKRPKTVKVDYSIDIKDILAEVQRDYGTEPDVPVSASPTYAAQSPKPTPPPPVVEIPPAEEKKPEVPTASVALDQEVVLEMLGEMQRLIREVEQLRAEVGAAGERPLLEAKAGKRVALSTEKKSSNRTEQKPKSKGATILGNIAFYGLLVALVLGAFLLKSHSSGAPFTFAGHAAFTVLTSSMEDTYPKGSLVVTKSVEPQELQIGDDITFMISQNSSVTHRIIGIIESYQNTGQRAFETKGTMNENPDKEPAIAANVVGKVIFCSVLLGQIAAFITKNWPFMLFLIVVLFGLVAFLKWNMSRPDEPEGKKAKEATSGAPPKEEKAIL